VNKRCSSALACCYRAAKCSIVNAVKNLRHPPYDCQQLFALFHPVSMEFRRINYLISYTNNIKYGKRR
jgi:hypothetical protein